LRLPFLDRLYFVGKRVLDWDLPVGIPRYIAALAAPGVSDLSNGTLLLTMVPGLPYRWIISSSSRAARRPEIARLPYLRDMTPAMIALILALAVRLLARVVAGCRAV
jgi:hypothetical protein